MYCGTMGFGESLKGSHAFPDACLVFFIGSAFPAVFVGSSADVKDTQVAFLDRTACQHGKAEQDRNKKGNELFHDSLFF